MCIDAKEQRIRVEKGGCRSGEESAVNVKKQTTESRVDSAGSQTPAAGGRLTGPEGPAGRSVDQTEQRKRKPDHCADDGGREMRTWPTGNVEKRKQGGAKKDEGAQGERPAQEVSDCAHKPARIGKWFGKQLGRYLERKAARRGKQCYFGGRASQDTGRRTRDTGRRVPGTGLRVPPLPP